MQWILLVLVISIVVGALRGGKLRNLTEIRVISWWLLPLALLVLTASNFVPTEYDTIAVGLVLASYVPLLLFVWLNRDLTGIWIAGMGILMNFTVILANGGMPVLAEAAMIAGETGELVLDAKHVLLTSATRLPFLADIIPLPGAVLSLGDVFLAIGVGVFLEDQMRQPLSLFAHRVTGIPGSAADS
ncbi:MAG TPA: DUF5317 domain-containing protein [Acidimicrobiia bacterium]|nr:DUF5317 domain-containing protein [Acidimicrobiia bacterium]